MKKTYILFSIGSIIVLLFFIVLQLQNCIFDQDYIPADSFSYIESADLLYNSFSTHPIRPFGYGLILGAPHLFFDVVTLDMYVIYNFIINLFFWFGTSFFLLKSLHLFFGEKSSFYITLLFMFCMGNISHIFLILTETIVTFLLTYMAFLLLKYIIQKKVSHLILGITILNLVVLFRPGMLYFSGLISLSLLFYLIKLKKFSFKKCTPFFLSLGLIFIQFISTYKIYGDFTLSYIDKETWYYYLGGESKAKEEGHNYMQERNQRLQNFSDLSWGEKSIVSKNDFKNQLSNNKINILKEYILNVIENAENACSSIIGTERVKNIKQDRFHIFARNFLSLISKIQNIFFTSLIPISFLLILYKRKEITIAITISFTCMAYIVLTSGISFWQGDRFHIVFYPLMMITFSQLIYRSSFAVKWLSK